MTIPVDTNEEVDVLPRQPEKIVDLSSPVQSEERCEAVEEIEDRDRLRSVFLALEDLYPSI